MRSYFVRVTLAVLCRAYLTMLLLVTVCFMLATGVLAIPDPASPLFTNSPDSSIRWRDCDSGTSWIHLDRLGLTPDQLHLPGEAYLTLHGLADHSINQNLTLHVSVYKRLGGFWTHVPCTDNLGSCIYNDICPFLDHFLAGGPCPQTLQNHNLPCSCPFNIPVNTLVEINNERVELTSPSAVRGWLTTGEYYVKVVAYEQTPGVSVIRLCLELFASVSVSVGVASTTTVTAGASPTTATSTSHTTSTTTTATTIPSSTVIDTSRCAVSRRDAGGRSSRQVPNEVASGFCTMHGSAITWRDCGGSGDHIWISVREFGMTPSEVRIPGTGHLTLHADVKHPVPENMALVVQINKKLLNQWTTVPCDGSLFRMFGSCTYTNACHFMQFYFPDGVCPRLAAHDLPCSCPFTIHTGQININEALTFPPASPQYTWLATGEYYAKLMLYEVGTANQRMCLEFFINLAKGN